jgi:CHAT domain-containing protein
MKIEQNEQRLYLSTLLLITTCLLTQWGSPAISMEIDQMQAANFPQTLTPDVPRIVEIAGGETHVWRVNLSAGDYLRLSVASKSDKLAAILFAPDPPGEAEQKPLFSTTDRNIIVEPGEEQAAIFSFVADLSGIYRLETSLTDKTLAQLQYRVTIETLRRATRNDRLRVAAERTELEGNLLIKNNATLEERMLGIAKYEASLAQWRELGDRRSEMRLLSQIGFLYRRLGEFQATLRYHGQAIQIARDLGAYHQEGDLTLSLGHVQRFQGETQKALDSYRRARQIFAGLSDRTGEARAIENIGAVLLSLGEARMAIDYLNQALRTFSIVGATSNQCNVLNTIGLAHISLGENQEALELHTRALELARKHRDTYEEAFSLRGLGNAYLALGDRHKATECYNQRLTICQTTGDRRCMANTLNSLGNVSFLSGEKEKALDYLSRSLNLFREVGVRQWEAETLYALARTNYSIGNLDEARKQLEAALEIRESLRANVSRHDLRASFFGSVQSGFDLYIDLLMSLHRQQPAAGYDALALRASERARARSLLEQLAEPNLDLHQSIDTRLIESEGILQQQLNAKAMARANLAGNKNSQALAAALDREIAELTSRYREVEAQIRASNPRYAALTRPEPLSVAEIQRQVVDENTVLLEFALGEKRSWLWAVTPYAIASRQLPPRAEIEAATRAVYQLLTARQSKAGIPEAEQFAQIADADAKFPGASRDLSRMLLDPIADLLRGEWKEKRLLIVASGALEYLPFAALPVPAGDGTYRPLIAGHEIVNLPSASVLSVIRSETSRRVPAPKTVAVLADPVFEADDPRVGKPIKQRAANRNIAISTRSASDPLLSGARSLDNSPLMRSWRSLNRGDLGRLPFSREEADAIANLAPDKSLLKATDFEASRSKVLSGDLADYRILHFATHGLLNSEHPELSGLVLSLVDENGKTQDGFLRMHDIYDLRLRAEVVVLSACQTGLGKEIKGEGLVGLTRGFMYAGAPRVIASLWKVDDLATAELMKHFYSGMLQDALRPAAALRAAQLEMAKQKRWSNPYFWAAFVIQGEWR